MRARRRHSALVLVAMAALVLTGCQQQAAPMSQMQTLVVDVADQIAGGDAASATSTLDALEAEVATRLEAGEIDAAEADRIRAAIALVRADLAAQTTPTPTPEVTEPTETDTEEPVQTTEPTTPAVEPVTPVAPTVTETEEADDTVDAPGNSGNTPGNSGNSNKDKDKEKKKD